MAQNVILLWVTVNPCEIEKPFLVGGTPPGRGSRFGPGVTVCQPLPQGTQKSGIRALEVSTELPPLLPFLFKLQMRPHLIWVPILRPFSKWPGLCFLPVNLITNHTWGHCGAACHTQLWFRPLQDDLALQGLSHQAKPDLQTSLPPSCSFPPLGIQLHDSPVTRQRHSLQSHQRQNYTHWS